MHLDFRYATTADNDLLHNAALQEDSIVRTRLDFHGVDGDYCSSKQYAVAVVACIDKEVVGFVKMSGVNLTGFNYISTLYVFPSFRRKGIGKRLLKFAVDYCSQTWPAIGVDIITIDNKPMEALIKKSGFKLLGTSKKHYYINSTFFNQTRWGKIYAK
jgi:ribosomal protein S18 acetylase RimI-like enzyme